MEKKNQYLLLFFSAIFFVHTRKFKRGFIYKIKKYIITSIAARGGGGSFKRLKLYNSEEHVPIESFGTTLIH